MRIIKVMLLTLMPALVGLAIYYSTVYPYSFAQLSTIIIPQLWYVEFYWLLISAACNYYMIRKLDRSRTKVGQVILIRELDAKN
jgi:hypothetical protein